MAKRVNPSVIGAFVLGGIGLFIAALVLFGSMDLFKDKGKWVTYFEGSVGGLSPGAPVTFRGVRVGTVTDVAVVVDVQKVQAHIPVYFEVDRSHIMFSDIGKETLNKARSEAIQAGLRAKLSMQSFVTGQMFVELDILPDSPARLVGADTSVPEMPSVESDIQMLKQKVSELPLEDLVSHADRVMQSIDQLVNSPEVKNSLMAAAGAMKQTEQLVTDLNRDLKPLFEDMSQTMKSTRAATAEATTAIKSLTTEGTATLQEYRKLAGTANGAAGDLRVSLKEADGALRQARQALSSVDGLLAADTSSRLDIEGTLDNLNKASNSLRAFADTLERNPNALVVGK